MPRRSLLKPYGVRGIGLSLNKSSIQARFLWAILCLLPLFLGSMAVALDRAHNKSLLQAENEKLQLHILNTITQLEVLPSKTISSSISIDEGFTLQMPVQLQDTNFNRPSSGQYAFVLDNDGNTLWQSASTQTWLNTPDQSTPAKGVVGEYLFQPEHTADLFTMSYRFIWELNDQEIPLQVIIYKSNEAHTNAISGYRNTLALYLTGITLLLSVMLFIIVRWGLAPLHRLSGQVKELEAGKRDRFEDIYAKELAPLVENLQALIKTERQQRERYRDTLADLAHSLKTPLAIIRGLPLNPQADQTLQEQVVRMNEIVDYQLQRAVTASPHRLMQQVDAANVIKRIVTALNKVYRDKNIRCPTNELPTIYFIGDERDLMEMLGNLLDNAYKYTRNQVAISLTSQDAPAGKQTLCISIEDNGDGIEPDLQQQILQRGQRLDTHAPGQGIGLAVTMDIISSYQGTLTISRSTGLGGACFALTLPEKAISKPY